MLSSTNLPVSHSAGHFQVNSVFIRSRQAYRESDLGRSKKNSCVLSKLDVASSMTSGHASPIDVGNDDSVDEFGTNFFFGLRVAIG